MKLLLIRHGETVDNVAQLYAGSRDSVLTSHGVLQAANLGKYLAANDVQLTHIFSSNLQRAFKTAEAVRLAQENPAELEVKQLVELREQDFGDLEGVCYNSKAESSSSTLSTIGVKAKAPHEERGHNVEAKAVLDARIDVFLDEHLWQILREETTEREASVAVVSHGITLSHLWKRVLRKFSPGHVMLKKGPASSMHPNDLERTGRWSNTGYLRIEIELRCKLEEENADNSKAANSVSAEKLTELDFWALYELRILASNSVRHLEGLKRTRGGVGSSAYDEKQQKMDKFFTKKPKLI